MKDASRKAAFCYPFIPTIPNGKKGQGHTGIDGRGRHRIQRRSKGGLRRSRVQASGERDSFPRKKNGFSKKEVLMSPQSKSSAKSRTKKEIIFFDLLKQDHDKVRGIFEQIEEDGEGENPKNFLPYSGLNFRSTSTWRKNFSIPC